jgi:hypothetical protein
MLIPDRWAVAPIEIGTAASEGSALPDSSAAPLMRRARHRAGMTSLTDMSSDCATKRSRPCSRVQLGDELVSTQMTLGEHPDDPPKHHATNDGQQHWHNDDGVSVEEIDLAHRVTPLQGERNETGISPRLRQQKAQAAPPYVGERAATTGWALALETPLVCASDATTCSAQLSRIGAGRSSQSDVLRAQSRTGRSDRQTSGLLLGRGRK